jgi:hypothetical protein
MRRTVNIFMVIIFFGALSDVPGAKLRFPSTMEAHWPVTVKW